MCFVAFAGAESILTVDAHYNTSEYRCELFTCTVLCVIFSRECSENNNRSRTGTA